MSSFKQKIKSKAFELGFTNFGVAKAAPLERDKKALEEWLNLGYNGSMAWMERNVEWRTDPTKYFPGAKSVISLGMNYYTPNYHSNDTAKGKISNYAWGEDYHDIINEKLGILIEELKTEFPESKFKDCCDTAPVMEKAWAEKAGIGWIGKHTNLITREMGSWLFLSEIITDLELEVDIPSFDYCGSCSLCIDSCPTGAIYEPYKLDSNRCISYLTIEHKGDFEIDTPMLDGWLYGCDICQEVCPWNNFQSETEELAFQPSELGSEIGIEYVAALTDAEFKELFKKSPIKRTKLAGLRRNAEKLGQALNAV